MRITRILSIALVAAATSAVATNAAEWQWRVPVSKWVSNETNANPDAFLWVPQTCDTVKAVMFAFQNMNEETLFEMESFRNRLSDMDVALVWIAPGFGQEWDVTTGVQEAFNSALADLAEVSGYREIATAPLIPFGHSAQATMPWNFAAWNPERTLCIISYHGDSPRTNLCGYGRANMEWGRTRNIDGIPGLMTEGEYEWWDARVRPALAFRMMYPQSCISFLGDAGRGHFDVAERTAGYIATFIGKAMEQRLTPEGLKPVDVTRGWLAEQWCPEQTKRAKAAPYAAYKGNPHEAFWYFDEEMAQLAEARYAETRGKQPAYVSYLQQGEVMPYNPNGHVKISGKFIPQPDGVTFNLVPVHTDSTHTKVVERAGKIAIRKVCGPVKVVDDTTFRVDFNRTGWDNPRRTWHMTLCAETPYTGTHKEAVQELEIRLPYGIKNGRRQTIFFPTIEDVAVGTEAVELQATADSGLPVYYYVKEGPAEIVDNRVVLSAIPPRAKYPVKVTVVAWQFGIDGQYSTAPFVEQTFYIQKP